MTLLCAPIRIETIEQAESDAQAARLAGAELIEFRIDGFFDPDDPSSSDSIAAMVESSPLPCIVTCRIAAEGGDSDGDDARRVELFRTLSELTHPPRYIDLELTSFESSSDIRRFAQDLHTKRTADEAAPAVILSTHDFDGRPPDLTRRLARMQACDVASVLKIAFRARSLRDNLELFEILDTRDRPMIALAMGEFGLMSRTLAPKFGAFLTFGSVRSEAVTAPGQPTLHELVESTRFHSLQRSTRTFGVIGWPVSHSMSPAIHNAGFESSGFDGVYLPLPIPPEWEHFKATVGALVDDPRLDFSGASVTIPHKSHLIQLALEREDEGWVIDDDARAIGAANTLCRTEEGWRVANTDAPAIKACLLEHVPSLDQLRVSVIGAGGVARAAVAAVCASGALVTIHARRAEQAEELIQAMRDAGVANADALSAAPIDELAASAPDIIIQATPVGMTDGPAPGENIIDLDAVATSGHSPIIFETIYNPVETPLMAQAQQRGWRTISGVDMFVRQAVAQFTMWTGVEAPISLFRRIVEDQLQSRTDSDA